MSTALQPVITKVGLAAILRADNTGIAAQITHVVLGTSGYTPSADQKSLVAQTAKYPIAGGERLSSTLLHLIALADGDRAFWVREIGFLLSDGTLLAVWSDSSTPLAYKSADTDLLLAYDLSLAALPADSDDHQQRGRAEPELGRAAGCAGAGIDCRAAARPAAAGSAGPARSMAARGR
ncbi:phage tail protein [Pseudomonas alloputida]|uniref:phage tail-collar fiber domain-containing protein n=1 Tax=Pseudomonas alloputida TaxID=1940621 RepID=UPI001E5C9553|nr:phage tail protein [Pseudomonas alloputida]MCE0904714.1 phage tail protein [Pseudomonas alloputida]